MDLSPETAEFLGTMVTALATILTAAITVFAPLLWAYLRRKAAKAGVELTDQQRRLLETYAVEAVRWAEEQARKRLKLRDPMDSDEKLHVARRRLRARCREDGVSCGENLDGLLEAVVHGERGEPTPQWVPGIRDDATPVERPLGRQS